MTLGVRHAPRQAFTLCLAVAALFWAMMAAASAAALETPARHAFLIDLSTGTVLFEKDAEAPTAPASMSKLMTLELVFAELAKGSLHLDDKLPVSERAWRMGGSKMFVMVGNQVSVEDLIRGVVVQSGNDACVVLAEGLAGSEEEFARRMTARAKEIGLKQSHFANSTGWPDPGQRMSTRDIALLAAHLAETYPQFYPYFAETEFTWNGIHQRNRNPLLYRNMDVDGLKTGHTEQSGYGLVASAEREGRRLVLVVNGLTSEQQRAEEAARLIEWGFRAFETATLFKAGEVVDRAAVWIGAEETVPLVLAQDLTLTLPRPAGKQVKVVAHYFAPVPAPVRRGQQIGVLEVSAEGMPEIERPLLAAEDVEPLGVFPRFVAAFRYILFGPPSG